MAQQTILFSHANGFPAGTYDVLFGALRDSGFAVHAIEKFGHDPAYPVTDNWPHLVRQLADYAQPLVEQSGARAYLVGHSLGGFLSLMCAARHPALAAGVVLLDSPLIGGWRAGALGLVKRTPLMKSVSPGAVSRKRRNAWADVEAVVEHFRKKKAFAAWDPRVLRDYALHGTSDDGAAGGRSLSFAREVETAIYDTLPHNFSALLKRHPLQCEVAFIGGRHSEELRRVGFTLTRRVARERIALVDGSHLFPMEKPLETAQLIAAALRSMTAAPPGSKASSAG